MATKNINKLELVHLPRANTVYIPEWFTGWPLWCPPPPPILDDRKWISIAFLTISDQYVTLFFHKMAAGGHFGWPKITFDHISRYFRTIRNFDFFFLHKMAAGGHFGWPKITFDRISRHSDQYATFNVFDFVHKMAAGGHFGWPKITFDRISRHFRSIRNFDFFAENGSQRPFWMTENHFWSHFSPFQINTQLLFFFTKWLPAAILEDRKSLLIVFLAISDQYTTFINFLFFPQMAAGGHFGWPKITFECISRHFRSIHNFFFKMAAGGPIGSTIWPI